MLHNIRESLGTVAPIVIGALLLIAAVLFLCTWLWILAGGLSCSSRRFFTNHSAIRRYLGQ